MWVATHIFSAKNFRKLYIESAKTVNEMTLNELVKLTTLWTTGPCYFSYFSMKTCTLLISCCSIIRPIQNCSTLLISFFKEKIWFNIYVNCLLGRFTLTINFIVQRKKNDKKKDRMSSATVVTAWSCQYCLNHPSKKKSNNIDSLIIYESETEVIWLNLPKD